MIEANKFYFLFDRDGFTNTTSLNHHMVRVLDKLGPLKMQMSKCDDVYNVFETTDGRIMTGAYIAKEYGFDWSFHITQREAQFFKELPVMKPVETHVPTLAIPEISLTITTMEEVHSAIIMLQGLQNAAV